MINETPLEPQELAEIAHSRVAFLSFLNLHFTTLPDTAFIDRLRNGELSAVLESLVNDPEIGDEIASGAKLMAAYLEQTQHEDKAKLSENLGVDRTRLYRGVAKGYGPPPPYEMVWSKSANDYGILQAVAKVYYDHGLAQSPEAKDRLDYIAIELDYIRELALREASAWQDGDTENGFKHLTAQNEFMSQHIGQWVPDFIDKAMEWAETDFYKGHLSMLRGFIAGQLEELSDLTAEMSG